MWKLNKSIAKELLPTQPVDFPIEPWWGVCLVNLNLEEFKVGYVLQPYKTVNPCFGGVNMKLYPVIKDCIYCL